MIKKKKEKKTRTVFFLTAAAGRSSSPNPNVQTLSVRYRQQRVPASTLVQKLVGASFIPCAVSAPCLHPPAVRGLWKRNSARREGHVIAGSRNSCVYFKVATVTAARLCASQYSIHFSLDLKKWVDTCGGVNHAKVTSYRCKNSVFFSP